MPFCRDMLAQRADGIEASTTRIRSSRALPDWCAQGKFCRILLQRSACCMSGVEHDFHGNYVAVYLKLSRHKSLMADNTNNYMQTNRINPAFCTYMQFLSISDIIA